MKRYLKLPSVIIKLGIINVIKYLKHKVYIKLNIYKYFYKIKPIDYPLINNNQKINLSKKPIYFDNECIKDANLILEGKIKLFNKNIVFLGENINWHKDHIMNYEINNKNEHWSKIKLYENTDIKRIWELSRWNWTVVLARSWITTKDYKYLYKLNELINDWCIKNSFNMGVNWADGQETAIRLINAFLTFRIVDQNKIPKYTTNRESFIRGHLFRLKQSYFYEQSQNNNHWISIAAGMFIGGGWLLKKSIKSKSIGNKYINFGQYELEKSLKKLVLEDGTFSQYSTNYH